MKNGLRGALLVLLAMASAASAQTNAGAHAMQARYESHKGDFDYLLGDWQFTASSVQYGKFGGWWSAVRIGDALILDEYRIVDDKGATIYVTRTLRAYNPALDQWDLVSTDPANGLQDRGSGHRQGGEVRIVQQFGKATMRIRYHDIHADRFSWNADRSTDGGKTWVENFQTIEARRVGPGRTLPALAPEKAIEPPGR
jgi:hypothetical protein